MKITPPEKRLHAAGRFFSLPAACRLFSRGGNFHARSRFARSTIPEEKWATTRSLKRINNGFSDSLWLTCSRRSASMEVQGEVTEEWGTGGGGRGIWRKRSQMEKEENGVFSLSPPTSPPSMFFLLTSLFALFPLSESSRLSIDCTNR